MFSAIRRRLHFSPATVIAGLALVFAMTGGAYAAKKFLITSTKQISPSVLKQLQGKAGVAGAPGAAGAQGAQGPAGPAGPGGPAGSAGGKGETGPAGAKGEKGATGNAGSAGAKGATGATGASGATGFTETLPSGKSETGTWSFRMPSTTGGAEAITPISFPIPLAHAGLEDGATGVQKAFFFTSEQAELGEFEVENPVSHSMEATGCHWVLEDPEAKPESSKPGTLCAFEEFGGSVGSTVGSFFFAPPGETGDRGYGPSGSYLYFFKRITAEPKEPFAYGTWVVTAP